MAEDNGSNSTAVVWHPVLKKYYTSMIGNAAYNMSVFEPNGKVFQELQAAGNDFRGWWFNPVKKRIEFNCYDTAGMGHLELDAKGKITAGKIDGSGMRQPDGQAVGVYHPQANSIIYLAIDHGVEKYNPTTGEWEGTFCIIKPGCVSKKEWDELTEDQRIMRWDARNGSLVQYTGIPKAEFAILNVEDRTIEYYNQQTGLFTRVAYKIPESVELQYAFNFSYSNGLWWFFNKTDRKWVGCK